MGKKKETVTVQQQTVPTPTAEETELNRLLLDQARAANPGIIATQSAGLDLMRNLLQGNVGALPELYQPLARGIDESVIEGIVKESIEDLAPQFQQAGLLDSGVRAAISGRVAGDIRRSAAEYNLGLRLNLANLATGGQAQVQQPALGYAGTLSSNLQGLRTISGSATQTTKSMNPFLLAFQTSFGNALGTTAGQWPKN